MAEYDTIPKQLIHIYPQDLVHLALGREDVEIEVEEILDTELPRVETRMVDSVIRVRIDGKKALVHIEFQTTDSANMAIRMAILYPPPHRTAMACRSMPLSSTCVPMPGAAMKDFSAKIMPTSPCWCATRCFD